MKKIVLVLVSALFILASCGNKNQDIINPDAEFRYFYGATCPHCQELNKRVEKEDLFSKISVEKREVYFNNDNREKFLEVTKEMGLDESKVGVPFVMHKASGEYAIGVDNALELFKKDFSAVLDEETPTEESPADAEVEAETENTSSEAVQ